MNPLITPSREAIDKAFAALKTGDTSTARNVLGLAPDTSFDGGRRIVGKSKPSKRKKAKRKNARKARRKNR